MKNIIKAKIQLPDQPMLDIEKVVEDYLGQDMPVNLTIRTGFIKSVAFDRSRDAVVGTLYDIIEAEGEEDLNRMKEAGWEVISNEPEVTEEGENDQSEEPVE